MLCTPSKAASTNAPWRSIRANTGTNGISMSVSTLARLGIAESFSNRAWCRRKVISASSAA
ncbi:hypothetical protein D3C79_914950 [compost metagenome]